MMFKVSAIRIDLILFSKWKKVFNTNRLDCSMEQTKYLVKVCADVDSFDGRCNNLIITDTKEKAILIVNNFLEKIGVSSPFELETKEYKTLDHNYTYLRFRDQGWYIDFYIEEIPYCD